MTRFQLRQRSLRAYWRIYLCVGLGAAITTGLITGALILGDSLEYSLRSEALSRIGGIDQALDANGRIFRSDLASDISNEVGAPISPALKAQGMANTPDGSRLASSVQLLGIDGSIMSLSAPEALRQIKKGESILNHQLAHHLGVQAGDEIVVRIPRTSAMPGGSPMARPESEATPIRLTVAGVTPSGTLGDFRLHREAQPPLNAFVDLSWLQSRLDLSGGANLLLVGSAPGESPRSNPILDAALKATWQIGDTSLEIVDHGQGKRHGLRSARVFLEASVVEAVQTVAPNARSLFTWFSFAAEAGERTSPYLFATALDDGSQEPLKDGEADILAWLAEDLGLKTGDNFTLRFPVFSANKGMKEGQRRFRVRQIIPMTSDRVDPALMPSFPGFHEAPNCRDWKPGIPIDLSKIRDKDEAYWRTHRGAPKVFISIAAAEEMWANPYGLRTGFLLSDEDKALVAQALPGSLEPRSVGLGFYSLRAQAIAASKPANDLGELFLGFSFLLITAALLLTGMIFGFGIRWRREELETLRTLGFSWPEIRALLMSEGMASAGLGAVVGICAGGAFTLANLHALATHWREAVGSTPIQFVATPFSILAGSAAAMMVVWMALWWVLRGLRSREDLPASTERIKPWGLGIFALGGSAAALLLAGSQEASILHFFGAGTCALFAGLGLCHELIRRAHDQSRKPAHGLWKLGIQFLARRPRQSITVVIMVAAGCYLVLAVAANRHDPLKNSERRDSGCGGFAAYAETALPIYGDLNTAEGRARYGLKKEDLAEARILSFRRQDGDDASCLNQGSARQPQILGAPWETLASLKAFGVLSSAGDKKTSPWSLLAPGEQGAPIPVMGDEATLFWGLGLKTGDEMTITDEYGRKQPLKVVATLSSGILQGSLIISEEAFLQLFPSTNGYRTFLIDAPPSANKAIAGKLSQSLGDHGLSLTPAWKRLALFQRVENTYLSIFQVLGFLGLALGALGVAILLLYNVVERREELSLLQALGFRRGTITSLLFFEHMTLILAGLAVGVIAGMIAAAPALTSPGEPVPLGALALNLLVVVASGAGSTLIAAWGALRNEVSS